MLFRTPLDELTDRIEQSIVSINSTRKAASRDRLLSPSDQEGLEKILDSAAAQLEAERDRIRKIAEQARPQIAIDRAWQLVRLVEAGAMDRDVAYELARHTPFEVQETLGYPEELRERLRRRELLLQIIDSTDFEICIEGYFKP